MNASNRAHWRGFVVLLAFTYASAIGVIVVEGCSAQQLDALREVRELAGDVCLEHDGWEACLKKCEAEKESRDAAAASP